MTSDNLGLNSFKPIFASLASAKGLNLILPFLSLSLLGSKKSCTLAANPGKPVGIS